MASVEGKRVFITGAASGIGHCTVEQFARAGCEIIRSHVAPGAGRHRSRE